MIKQIEKILDFGGTKKDIVLIVISGISLLLSLMHIRIGSFDFSWIAIVLCGIPIILEAFVGLVTEFDIKADVLVSLALIASVYIGEYFAAGEVAFIMQIGGLLEELTVARARSGIEKLVHLTPRVARVLNGDQTEMIPAQDVKVGSILRVLPGETVPVDGVIVKGQTSINQSVMTGESLPVDKMKGDEVSSGTVNLYGSFDMKATKVGEDSSIQRMIKLVQSADAGKAKIVGLADRWATWIVVIALLSACITWIATKEILRSVTILVVFCPCALVLATPTAIMAAIGNATKHGFLVREGDALERLAHVQNITFDKTGTLTYGQLQMTAISSKHLSEKQLFHFAASVEKLSEHPIGKAIVKSFREKYDDELLDVQSFQMIPGQGIQVIINSDTICVGNQRLLSQNHISIEDDVNDYLQKGATVIYVGINGQYAGFMALSDTIRSDSQKMITQLQNLGLTPILLTGDNENAANDIAQQLHIHEVVSHCLPEDKLNQIDAYQTQGKAVCMIGDGINDAPALKKADVGIAMGGIGSDIAVDAADIALVDDKVEELPHLFALSKRMMKTIQLNLTFSMTLNFIAIVLAITGILNPVVGALVHNAGSVLVIINSALLLNWKMHTK